MPITLVGAAEGIAASGGTTATVPKPSLGQQDGDLWIIKFAKDDDPNITLAATGFTVLRRRAATTSRARNVAVYYKTVDITNDPTQWDFSQDAENTHYVIECWRGVHATDPFGDTALGAGLHEDALNLDNQSADYDVGGTLGNPTEVGWVFSLVVGTLNNNDGIGTVAGTALTLSAEDQSSISLGIPRIYGAYRYNTTTVNEGPFTLTNTMGVNSDHSYINHWLRPAIPGLPGGATPGFSQWILGPLTEERRRKYRLPRMFGS